MQFRARHFAAIAVFALAAPLAAQTPAPAAPAAAPAKLTADEEARFLALGKTYTRWFLAGKADSILTVMAPDMAANAGGIGGVEGVRTMMNQLAERAGVETKIVEEKLTRRNGRVQFWHAGIFSDFADEEVVLRWIFDANGKITGAGMNPKSKAPAPDPS